MKDNQLEKINFCLRRLKCETCYGTEENYEKSETLNYRNCEIKTRGKSTTKLECVTLHKLKLR